LRKIDALKKLQDSVGEIDVEYKKERILLEIKYRLLNVPLVETRDKIISGEIDVPKEAGDENPGT
jgi:hypothetical protein